jgi:hypothetical protein
VSAPQRHEGAPGSYTLRVRYFDYPQGTSRFHPETAALDYLEILPDGPRER